MLRKQPISLDEYVKTLNYYRFEFLKRSDQYLTQKNEMCALLQKKGLNFSEEAYDIAHNPVRGYIVPDENGTLRFLNGEPLERLAMTGELVVAKCEPPKPLEFTFKSNPYATIDEFNAALEQFKKDTALAFKTVKKYGHASTQTSYIVNEHGKVDFFRAPGSGKPFSHWERLKQAYDLKKDGNNNAGIGKKIRRLYGCDDGRALDRAVSTDLKEAIRLISYAKYNCFPYDPPQTKPANAFFPQS